MNKKLIIRVLAILMVSMIVPQSAVAKKVVCIGYQYIGEVNKENGPQDNDNKIDLSKCFYEDFRNFRILYSNGNIIKKSIYNYDEYPTITIKDKECLFILYPEDMDDMGIQKVVKGEQQLPSLSTPWGSNDPYHSSFRIGVLNKGNLSEDELNKIIKESVLPMFDIKKSSKALVFRYCNGTELLDTDGSGPFIGAYINGEYLTNTTIEKDDAKKEAATRQELYKKYGKTYVDAVENGKLLVGMPWKLLINEQMKTIRPGISVYKMYVYNDGESGQYKVKIAVIGKSANGWSSGAGIYYKTYRIWVKNWKITQFREWTKSDEALFKRL